MAAKELFSGGESGALYVDRRKFYYDEKATAELWKGVEPFLHFLKTAGGRKVTDDNKFKLFEHRSSFQNQLVRANGTATIGNDDTGAALTVDGIVGLPAATDSSYIGLTFEIWSADTGATGFKQTSEFKGVALCTAVGTLSLTLKSLDAAAISVADNDYLYVAGNARGERTTAPEAWADELEVVYNQIQFFSTSVEISKDLFNTVLRGYSSEIDRLRREKAKEFLRQKSDAYLRGYSVAGTGMSGTAFADTYRTNADGQPVRTTMGLIPIIRKYGSSTAGADNQNIWTDNANDVEFEQLLSMTEHMFQYNDYGGVMPMFCGRGYLSFWSQVLGRGDGSSWKQYQLYPMQENKLGYMTKVLTTPHGDLMLTPTDSLKRTYHDTGIVVSPDNMYEAVQEAEEFKNNIKTEDDYDGIKDVYRGKSGFGLTLQEKFHLHTITR